MFYFVFSLLFKGWLLIATKLSDFISKIPTKATSRYFCVTSWLSRINGQLYLNSGLFLNFLASARHRSLVAHCSMTVALSLSSWWKPSSSYLELVLVASTTTQPCWGRHYGGEDSSSYRSLVFSPIALTSHFVLAPLGWDWPWLSDIADIPPLSSLLCRRSP